MSRRALLGLSLVLEACASSVMSSSAASPGANCQFRVCIYEHKGEHYVEFAARNDDPVAATVTLTFEAHQTGRRKPALPIVRIVPPGQRMVLMRLGRRDAEASMGAHSVIEIDLGSDSTVPDPAVSYSAPFGGSEPRQLIGGYGSPTHLEANFYALDFAMPEGTPVLAGRSGIVVYLQDGFTEGGLTPDLLERANLVAIAHADGTIASYGHLRPGLEVAEGDTVARGQLLGFSGSTGFSGQPHLHFHVGKRLMGGDNKTIPIKLQDREGAPRDPTEGEWYGPAPRRG